jgi:multiple sugar transport system substrate-binding protein
MPKFRPPALPLLAALMLCACIPVTAPAPVVTAVQPTITSTASPGLKSTSTPRLTPSPTPLPPIDVNPGALHGLKIQAWNAFAGTASDLFIRQAEQFNATNEWGIVVSLNNLGDYPSLFESVSAALDSGQPPDLVAALPEQTLAWDALEAVVDLARYLSDPQYGFTAEERADIPPIFLAQDHVNGRQVGLPAQRSARLLFYNQTWAREMRFTKPPATAEDFRKQACSANAFFLKDKDVTNDGKGGWVVDTAWQTVYAWMLSFDGSVVDGVNYGFRTDPNLAALEFIKGLSDSHCAWPSETPYESFASRTALFISADLSEIPAVLKTMESMNNQDEWIVIPYPGPRGRVEIAYGPSYSVLKTTPERQLAAWLFARWLLSPENQSQWVEQTGLFPLRTSLIEMIDPYRQAVPQWDGAVGSLAQAQNVPQLASWRRVRYVLEDGMTVVFQKNTPVEELPFVLEEMDAMAQELK